MSFFGALKADVEAVGRKIESVAKQAEPLLTEAIAAADAEIKREILSVVQRIVGYVEARLPEIEAAAVAAVEAAVPAAAGIIADVAPAAEALLNKEAAKVAQAVDGEEPK